MAGASPTFAPRSRFRPSWWPSGPHVARAAVGLSTLAIVGASIGLCAGFASVPDTQQFLISNQGTWPVRNLIMACMMIGAALPVLIGMLLLLRGLPGLDTVDRAGKVFAPLSLVGLVPVLFAHRAWGQQPLTFLLMLAVVALVAERLCERSFRAVPDYVLDGLANIRFAAKWRPHLPTIVVVAAALAYAIYFSHFTLMNHRRFGTYGFDLGINVNWCYNALQGSPFRSTVLFGPDGGHFFAGHAIFAMFMWLPVFALMPGPEILLIYQSVMIGIAAIPLYLFARTLLPRWTAAVVAVAYLIYAPLHGPNFYDYHELPVALPFHFTLYWLIATNRLKWAALVVPILWGHREDVSVGLTVLGLFLVLTGHRVRFGLGLAVASAIWFILVKFVLMPAMGAWWFIEIYKELQPNGTGGYGGVVQTILINPAYFFSTLLREQKLIYFLHLFAPVVFLPTRRLLLFMLALPGFCFTLMTTGYPPTVSIAFQYTTHWIPYIFAATVLALHVLGQQFGAERRRAAVCAMALAVSAHSTVFGAIFQHDSFVGGFAGVSFVETDEDRRNYEGFQALAKLIPPDASVAASENEIPHLSARRDAYTLKDVHGDATYVLVRRHGNMNVQVFKDAFERNDYGLVKQHKKLFYLFKKDLESEATQQALVDLGLARKKKPKNRGKPSADG
jgi:uncharacterized membrane protein